jgi:transcription elongation factor Elf1
MDVEHKVGTILCDGCGAKFTAKISQISDPIDVYSEWIDASEAVNEPGAAEGDEERVEDDDDF